MNRSYTRPKRLLVALCLVLAVMLSMVSCASPTTTPTKEAAKTAAPTKEEAKPTALAKEEARPATAKPEVTALPQAEAKPAAATPAPKSADLAVPKEKVTLKLAHNMPINHQIARGMDLFAKEVGDLSKGQITIEVFPAGQLFNDSKMVEAIGTNSVPMGVVTGDLLAEEVPGADIFSQPFSFTSFKHLHNAIDGAMGQAWSKGVEAKGFHPLALLTYGFTHSFSNKRQLKTPEDFKGMKMRAVGASTAETLKALGSSPVYMGAGEVYTSLQRNTIDGYVTGVTSVVDRKLYEVTKYAQINHIGGVGVFPFLYNKEAWGKLSPEAQKIIEVAAKDASDFVRAETQRLEEEATQEIKAKGMEVYILPETDFTTFQKAAAPALDVYVSKGGDFAKELLKLAQEAK